MLVTVFGFTLLCCCSTTWARVQVMPWILDVGYTVLLVALLVAFMGHLLFGDFEVTMKTLSASISGLHQWCLGYKEHVLIYSALWIHAQFRSTHVSCCSRKVDLKRDTLLLHSVGSPFVTLTVAAMA